MDRMTSHVIAYGSSELLFCTHTFNFKCFFDDFNCVFTQIRCLSRLLIKLPFVIKIFVYTGFAVKNQTKQTKSGIPSVSNSLDPDQARSGSKDSQTICKSYQQTTLIGKQLKHQTRLLLTTNLWRILHKVLIFY